MKIILAFGIALAFAGAHSASLLHGAGLPVNDTEVSALYGGTCNEMVDQSCGLTQGAPCTAKYAKGLGAVIPNQGACFAVDETIQCSTDSSTGCGAVYVLTSCVTDPPGEW